MTDTIKDDIQAETDALAMQIAKEAQGMDVELALRIDAIKALTSYRVGDHKTQKKDDAKGVGSFRAVRDRIASVNSQNGKFKPREPETVEDADAATTSH